MTGTPQTNEFLRKLEGRIMDAQSILMDLQTELRIAMNLRHRKNKRLHNECGAA